MFKLLMILCAILAMTLAKPTFVGAPVAYTAPVVTATSSQYFVRNHNAAYVAAPYVAAPYVAATSPIVSSPLVAAPYTYYV